MRGKAGNKLVVVQALDVTDTLEVDGVELALRGADAAADAHVLVKHHSAAAKAALGLLLHLLLCQGAAQVTEGLDGLGGAGLGSLLARREVQAAHRHAGFVLVDGEVLLDRTADDQALTLVHEG